MVNNVLVIQCLALLAFLFVFYLYTSIVSPMSFCLIYFLILQIVYSSLIVVFFLYVLSVYNQVW